MSEVVVGEVSWERMVKAVELVRDRLLRATKVLRDAGVPYAVIGGNAVAAWVSRVDTAAVRNTQDVDILLQRSDFEDAKVAMNKAGFLFRHVEGIDMFLEGPGAKARDAVHIIFAGEKVKPSLDLIAAPDVDDSEDTPEFRVISLEALVRMKLTSYRRKDQVHLQDMIGIGLIDESWVSRVPEALGSRLQVLLDDPEG